jgi:hypothetical protein
LESFNRLCEAFSTLLQELSNKLVSFLIDLQSKLFNVDERCCSGKHGLDNGLPGKQNVLLPDMHRNHWNASVLHATLQYLQRWPKSSPQLERGLTEAAGNCC